MATFDFTNFERQGNIENDIHLDNVDDIREAILNASASALRTIKIFTPDLEPTLYDNDQFRETLLAFTRGNRHAEIQILLEDTTYALHNGHRLIPLAQQLTSAMTIKDIPEDYFGSNISFILIDQSSFIYRPDRTRQFAIYSECKNRANKLIEFVTPIWEHAHHISSIRRLSI